MFKFIELYNRVKAMSFLRVHNLNFYVLDGIHYLPVSKIEVMIRIRALLQAYEQGACSPGMLKNVVDGLAYDPDLQISFVDHYCQNFIPLKRYVLDLRDFSMGQVYVMDVGNGQKIFNFVPEVEVNPAYGELAAFSYYIEAEYIPPTYRNISNFDAFLQTSFPTETVEAANLLEDSLATIISAYFTKCFFLFFGESDSGKSVLCKFISAIVKPSAAVSHVEPEKLNDRFSRNSLTTSHLNVVTEIDANSFKRKLNTIKAITSGETLTVEEKFEPMYSAPIRCKLLFAGNELPEFRTSGMSAIISRAVMLHFPVSIPKEQQDPLLFEKLFLERDSIVSNMIDRLPELTRRNFCYKLPNSSQYWLNYLAEQDPRMVMRAFINDYCDLGDFVTHTCRVYEAFTKFCEANLIDPKIITKYRFGQTLYTMPGCRCAGKVRLPDEPNPCVAVHGLRLKDNPGSAGFHIFKTPEFAVPVDMMTLNPVGGMPIPGFSNPNAAQGSAMKPETAEYLRKHPEQLAFSETTGKVGVNPIVEHPENEAQNDVLKELNGETAEQPGVRREIKADQVGLTNMESVNEKAEKALKARNNGTLEHENAVVSLNPEAEKNLKAHPDKLAFSERTGKPGINPIEEYPAGESQSEKAIKKRNPGTVEHESDLNSLSPKAAEYLEAHPDKLAFSERTGKPGINPIEEFSEERMRPR